MKIIGAFIAVVMLASPAGAQRLSEDEYLKRMMAGGPMLDPPELERALAEAEKHPLGSKQNPVRASRPAGQRAYLDTLRCSDGTAPRYTRSGNVGAGVFASIVDLYVVDCGEAKPGRQEVYMDMYFPGYQEKRIVPAFADSPPAPTPAV